MSVAAPRNSDRDVANALQIAVANCITRRLAMSAVSVYCRSFFFAYPTMFSSHRCRIVGNPDYANTLAASSPRNVAACEVETATSAPAAPGSFDCASFRAAGVAPSLEDTCADVSDNDFSSFSHRCSGLLSLDLVCNADSRAGWG